MIPFSPVRTHTHVRAYIYARASHPLFRNGRNLRRKANLAGKDYGEVRPSLVRRAQAAGASYRFIRGTLGKIARTTTTSNDGDDDDEEEEEEENENGDGFVSRARQRAERALSDPTRRKGGSLTRLRVSKHDFSSDPIRFARDDDDNVDDGA